MRDTATSAALVEPSTHRQYELGVVLVVLSAAAFSSAGIFTKSVSADAWSVIFWRGVSGALFALIFLIARSRFRDELRRFGLSACIATILMASGTAAFIPAFKLTSVANVSLIWATSPFVAALLAWVSIRERPSRRNVLCSILALVGVAFTVSSSFGSKGILGDMLALWMTFMMAGTMVVYRVWPGTPTVLPAAFSSLILLIPAMIVTEPANVSFFEIKVLILFGLVFSVASITLVEGARWIPSGQAALISALETPLAPIWALIILAEVPAFRTVLGGGIIMAAVILSQKSGTATLFRSLSGFMFKVKSTPFSELSDHLRRDAGHDYPRDPSRPDWRDPLQIEIRRLR